MTERATKPVKEEAVTVTPTPAVDPTPSRLTKLKTAFMYVLIAGLAAAAITSVVALLVGEFSSGIAKSLLTILIFFSHSLLILAVLWADRFNQVGKLPLPTAIVFLVFANLISTTLGTWEIISAETAWRAFSLYFLIIGAVFIAIGLLRLRIAHQVTQIALYTTIGLITAVIIALVPWVLQIISDFDPLYYRIVAAISILSATALIISIVIRSIAIGRNENLKLTAPKKQQNPGGLLAVYIVIGVITANIWVVGLTAFLVSGIQSSYPPSKYHPYNRYY